MHPSSAKLKPSLFARTFLSSSFGSEMWQDHRLLESFTWHLIHGHSNCNQDGFAKAQIYQNLSAKTSPSWKINTKHSSNCKNIISLFTLLINPPFSGSFFSSTNQRRLKQVYLQPPPCHETSAVLCLFTTQLCSTKLQPGRCFSRDDELILPGILVMIITMRMRMRSRMMMRMRIRMRRMTFWRRVGDGDEWWLYDWCLPSLQWFGEVPLRLVLLFMYPNVCFELIIFMFFCISIWGVTPLWYCGILWVKLNFHDWFHVLRHAGGKIFLWRNFSCFHLYLSLPIFWVWCQTEDLVLLCRWLGLIRQAAQGHLYRMDLHQMDVVMPASDTPQIRSWDPWNTHENTLFHHVSSTVYIHIISISYPPPSHPKRHWRARMRTGPREPRWTPTTPRARLRCQRHRERLPRLPPLQDCQMDPSKTSLFRIHFHFKDYARSKRFETFGWWILWVFF